MTIGFALKDVFENCLAGVIILFRRKMRIGDFIECEGIKQGGRNFRPRHPHPPHRRAPRDRAERDAVKNPLTVRTDEDQRRATTVCGVAHDEDVDAAPQVIEDAVRGRETVITDGRPVQIFAQAFNSSSIDLDVTWWTGSKPIDIRRSRDEVGAAVKALDDAGIEIPFPYRTLTFEQALPLAQAAGDEREAEA